MSQLSTHERNRNIHIQPVPIKIMVPKLLRYQLFLLIGIILLLTWRIGLTNLDSIKVAVEPLSIVSPPTMELLITYMPLFAILLLGVYALTCVIYKVITFEDCNYAAKELSEEILVAKEKLKKVGYTF